MSSEVRSAMSGGVHGLYAIIDLPHPSGLEPVDVARAMLNSGSAGQPAASMIQLRAKDATTEQRITWLKELGPVCKAAGVPLIVNDDLEAAFAGIEGLCGVHLGQTDPGADELSQVRARADQAGLPLVVGLSTHSLEQLRAASLQRPDYVAFGPVAPTVSKPHHEPVVGLDGLAAACRFGPIPLVAIGGLDEALGCRAIELGAAMVAVIGQLVESTPSAIEARARTLARAFEASRQPLSLEDVAKRVPVLEPELLEHLADWSDDLGTHISLGLPARFRPRRVDGVIQYRPCDVVDLLYALDKWEGEDWTQWEQRTNGRNSGLVTLRRPRPSTI